MARQRRPAPPSNQPAATPTRRPKQRAAWLVTLDSYGGLGTLSLIGVAVIAVVALVVYMGISSNSSAVSKDPEIGEHITAGGAGTHVTDPSQLKITPGQPPVGGPHVPTPQAPGYYTSAIPDGNAIHSLEHGIIWITYNSKLGADDIAKLKSLQSKYSKDVMVSPRPDNSMLVAAASWEYLLKQDTLNTSDLEKFIKTNRNRSPEPGLR